MKRNNIFLLIVVVVVVIILFYSIGGQDQSSYIDEIKKERVEKDE